MPQYCCVPCCNNTGGHLFPVDAELQLKWRVAIRRIDPKTGNLWMPNLSYDRVCKRHFIPEDYVQQNYKNTSSRRPQKLIKAAVPSIFTFKAPRLHSSIEREQRLKKRKAPSDNLDIDDIGNEEVVSHACLSIDEDSKYCDVGSQVGESLIENPLKFLIQQYKNDEKAIHYFTGFDDYNHFKMFFNVLGPAVDSVACKFQVLDAENQFFLTLIKLRQNLDHELIGIMFGVSVGSVSKIFSTWCNFMYYQLKELDIWPSKKVVLEPMPKGFKRQFPTTRVVLDATEIPIIKPKNVELQSQTFSTYKNKNTIKAMIGITPRGLVSHISDCYAGSSSDRQVIEDSCLYTDAASHFSRGDSIMADRGIMVQDLFAPYDVAINAPTLLKGKSQLDPSEVVNDRRVASKRIHVERVIGLAKWYKILKSSFPQGLIPLSSKINFLCFMMVNFKRSIVGESALSACDIH